MGMYLEARLAYGVVLDEAVNTNFAEKIDCLMSDSEDEIDDNSPLTLWEYQQLKALCDKYKLGLEHIWGGFLDCDPINIICITKPIVMNDDWVQEIDLKSLVNALPDNAYDFLYDALEILNLVDSTTPPSWLLVASYG